MTLDATVIGVISDTHLTGPSSALHPSIPSLFAGADLILHAGDLVTLEVIGSLEAIAPVQAVCGNMDGMDVRARLADRKTLLIEGLNLGLIHGWGAPEGIRGRIRGAFGNVQAIVYGHTHEPFAGWEGGVYFFNPGAASGRRRHHPSVGRLTIGEGIKGEILPLD